MINQLTKRDALLYKDGLDILEIMFGTLKQSTHFICVSFIEGGTNKHYFGIWVKLQSIHFICVRFTSRGKNKHQFGIWGKLIFSLEMNNIKR